MFVINLKQLTKPNINLKQLNRNSSTVDTVYILHMHMHVCIACLLLHAVILYITVGLYG